MQHVENCEGNNFVSDIGMSWSGIEFSKEEKALLEKLNKDTLCDDPLQDYLNDVVYCENCGNDVEK